MLIATRHFIGLPDIPETPGELTARARSLIPSARACAEANGHALDAWKRASARKDERHYSAECLRCHSYAYVHTAYGINEYGGGAVLDTCAGYQDGRELPS